MCVLAPGKKFQLYINPKKSHILSSLENILLLVPGTPYCEDRSYTGTSVTLM
jgi:hypothetical protein